MESELSWETPGRFAAPEASLGDLGSETAAKLIAAAADLALIVDPTGIILDLALSADGLAEEGIDDWIGKPWADVVTVESRPKVADLLREASLPAHARWRQVNHPSRQGPDVPIRYSAIKAGSRGHIVAMGRDLRAIASLQRKLVDAQLGMEREYARVRAAETRYRLLFHTTAEPVLIIEASTMRVVEANPAAGRVLGRASERAVGRPLLELVDGGSAAAVQAMLAAARSTGHADETQARLAHSGREVGVVASMFRQENTSYFVVRVRLPGDGSPAIAPRAESQLLRLVDALPDGFVVTDLERRIVSGNPAFLSLAQLSRERQVLGEPLERWLGRSSVDLNALIANLREHGAIRSFPTVIRSEYGSREEVEVSAVAVLHGEEPCFGFVLRPAGRRPQGEARAPRELPRSVEQLTELIGRVPLKDLVRETTDVIERLCIEAALELTGDNRASAAQMLGLSRQSLYVKLRRYGLPESADGTFAAQ